MESDDEPLSLSSSTLAALQEFKKEEKKRIEMFENLSKEAEKQKDNNTTVVDIDLFQEDWQLSQFWYDDKTAEILGKAILEGADENTVVAIASAPSVYAAIKKFDPNEIPTKHIYLLEYDTRFRVLAGDEHFFHYDFYAPNNIPDILRHKCHRVLIDPPFLEDECQTNSATAARNLLIEDKSLKTMANDLQFKLVSSTGERMRDVIKRNYPETKITNFYPQHKNGLSNEFRCYASFECSYWSFE